MPGLGLLRHGERGQSLAEFAVISFVLMLIILGIVDFSRAVYARSIIASAAREGARYGSTHPTDTANIEKAARALVDGLDMSRLQVTVARPDALHVQVTVTYTFEPASALISQYITGSPGGGILLTSRSLMRTES